jgi:hypothetical protein
MSKSSIELGISRPRKRGAMTIPDSETVLLDMSTFGSKRTSKLSQSVIAKFAGAMPDFTVGVTTDWS